MKQVRSIAQSLNLTILKNCILSLAICVCSIIVAVGIERDYWRSNQMEDYKKLAVLQMTNQFDLLTQQSRILARNAVTAQNLVTDNVGPNDWSSIPMTEDGADIVVVQNMVGKLVSSIGRTSNQYLRDLKALHEPFDHKPFPLTERRGTNFIEGRIFMFSSTLIMNHAKPIGLLTSLKEVDSEIMMSISQKLGKDFNFHYTSAGLRLTQVSYDQGFNVSLHQVVEKRNGYEAEYQVTMTDGRVQPANFLIRFHDHSYRYFNPIVLTAISALLVILLTVLLWASFARRVIKPMNTLTGLMSQESKLANRSDSLDLNELLPQELALVYEKFKKVYISMSQQNQFSQVLVDAIGDIIITVNTRGTICYANPAARQWFGVCETLIIGQPLELFTSNLSSETSDVTTWLYKSNELKERVSGECKLVNLICKEFVYPADVIVQPIEVTKDDQDVSSSVVVIRLKGRISVK
ncbi:PAS domain-containing protein [Vibrio profundi]|uniref:PAS domain-containing protein n=1 Tax=Vibrio profundi TaxID=1774960 RepID=UPI003736B469